MVLLLKHRLARGYFLTPDTLILRYRNIFSNLSSIKFEDLASWLMLAFVLSREIPVIFQKVILSFSWL